MSFKEDIKELLTFSKGERKGIIVLLIILFIVISAKLFSGYFKNYKSYDFTDFETKVADFEQQLIHSRSSLSKKPPSCFKFNPNIASDSEFYELGLDNKQIQTIRNYISKGGRFEYRSDFKKIYTISDEFYAKLEAYIDLSLGEEKVNKEYKVVKNPKSLFYFNPNTASDDEWLKLGFSQKQVAVIRKYISRGGEFYEKDDLKKLYVIDEKKYKELEPYILIPQTKLTTYKQKDYSQTKIDINAYSKNDFAKLGGNWTKLAERLVKFRKLLGGFAEKEQLLEVYGFGNKDYEKVKDLIYIDQSLIKKININFAEVYDLSKHPYLSKLQAESILNYRNSNGPFKSTDQLKNLDLITDQDYNKIKPYLKIKD